MSDAFPLARCETNAILSRYSGETEKLLNTNRARAVHHLGRAPVVDAG